MENIGEYLISYGYLFLFLYSLGGGFVALVVAGAFSQTGSMQNPLDIQLVVLTAFIANFLGDNLLIYMSKYQKKDFMVYVSKHKRKLALCKIWIKKYEYSVIFIQKFLYGIKTLIPIAIGLSGYNVKKFIIINFFASALWAVSVGYASYYLSLYVQNLFSFFDDKPYLPILILAGTLLGFFFVISKVAQKKINNT